MRHRFGRNKSNEFPSFVKVIILITLLSSFGSILSVSFDLIFGLIAAAFALASIALPFAGMYFAIKAISNAVNKNKKGTTTIKSNSRSSTNSTINTDELLKKLSKYLKNNEVINIDDETYLTITDKDNITLKTIDIYMREEYIGTLQDYLTAYPNAYNQLADKLIKYINKKNRELNKAKKQEQTTVNPISNDNKQTTQTNEKDADYYVKTLIALNDQNPNEQITAGLNETCEFLRSIKKIEDEYPESKEKTSKLYEYYLPMLTDILANYNRLYASTTNQADFKASEDRLLKTIVLINGALKTISSGLLEDYYSEINVDMRTLESILKKDGLVEDFKQEG